MALFSVCHIVGFLDIANDGCMHLKPRNPRYIVNPDSILLNVNPQIHDLFFRLPKWGETEFS